jgi:fructose-specific component phosphotransferase system IIB-like protein
MFTTQAHPTETATAAAAAKPSERAPDKLAEKPTDEELVQILGSSIANHTAPDHSEVYLITLPYYNSMTGIFFFLHAIC